MDVQKLCTFWTWTAVRVSASQWQTAWVTKHLSQRGRLEFLQQGSVSIHCPWETRVSGSKWNTDQEEMSLLSTWDYNADEFHILVRECFLLEKTRKKSLDSDPVTKKQTKMWLKANWKSFRLVVFLFLCSILCVCVRMQENGPGLIGTRFCPWPDFLNQGGLTSPEGVALKLL